MASLTASRKLSQLLYILLWMLFQLILSLKVECQNWINFLQQGEKYPGNDLNLGPWLYLPMPTELTSHIVQSDSFIPMLISDQLRDLQIWLYQHRSELYRAGWDVGRSVAEHWKLNQGPRFEMAWIFVHSVGKSYSI